MESKASRRGRADGLTDQMRQQLEADEQQMALAEKRMGRTPEEHLRWVIKFTQQDLDALRPEERIALGYDLRMLASLGWAPPRTMQGVGGYGYTFRQEAGPMSDEDLRALHLEIAQGIQGLMSEARRPWQLPPPQALNVSRGSPAGAKKKPWRARKPMPKREPMPC